ncbi:hypothetical protein BD770DRAFT_469370 [Pilaira anomala]|nr:hypothetical protein BD770DRAFT_469370 [Pilaira anomala]
MKLWWIIQVCLTVFTLLLSFFKFIKFQPAFFVIDDHPLDILILLVLNCIFCLLAVIFKLAAFQTQNDPDPRLKNMASLDLLLSAGILGVNGYGMTLKDYRWFGCEISIICQSMSAYSWYAIAELVSASLSFFYALYMLINIFRKQHTYSSDLPHQNDGDSTDGCENVKNDNSEDKDIEIARIVLLSRTSDSNDDDNNMDVDTEHGKKRQRTETDWSVDMGA